MLRNAIAAAAMISTLPALAQTPPEEVLYPTQEMVSYLEAVGFTDVAYKDLNWGSGWFEVSGVSGSWAQGGSLEIESIRFDNITPDNRWLRTDGLLINGFALDVPGFALSVSSFSGTDFHVRDIDSFTPTAAFSGIEAAGVSASFGGFLVGLDQLQLNGQNWEKNIAVPGKMRGKMSGTIGGNGLQAERFFGELDWNLSDYGDRATLISAFKSERSGDVGFLVQMKGVSKTVLWAWDDLNRPLVIGDDEKRATARAAAKDTLNEVLVEEIVLRGKSVPWFQKVLTSLSSISVFTKAGADALLAGADAVEAGEEIRFAPSTPPPLSEYVDVVFGE